MSAMFYGILGFDIGFFVGFLVIFIMPMKKAIINLINKWACHHNWVLVKETKVSTDFGGSYIALLFVCKKCGKFKKLKTNPG